MYSCNSVDARSTCKVFEIERQKKEISWKHHSHISLCMFIVDQPGLILGVFMILDRLGRSGGFDISHDYSEAIAMIHISRVLRSKCSIECQH